MNAKSSALAKVGGITTASSLPKKVKPVAVKKAEVYVPKRNPAPNLMADSAGFARRTKYKQEMEAAAKAR